MGESSAFLLPPGVVAPACARDDWALVRPVGAAVVPLLGWVGLPLGAVRPYLFVCVSVCACVSVRVCVCVCARVRVFAGRGVPGAPRRPLPRLQGPGGQPQGSMMAVNYRAPPSSASCSL